MQFHMRLLALIVVACPVDSIEESFCAGLGYSDDDSQHQGLRSMGWHAVYSHPESTLWATTHADSSPTRNDGIRIGIYGVKFKGKFLKGWLHIRIFVAHTRNNLMALAVWALTNTKESIGEFIPHKYAQCVHSNVSDSFHYIPCSAAPINEPTIPNMFVFMDGEQKEKPKYLDLLWRTSLSYCNMPKEFRFMFAFNSKTWNRPRHFTHVSVNEPAYEDVGPIVYASEWITPKFYGAASPFPTEDSTTLSCGTGIYDGKVTWIRGIPGGEAFTPLEKLDEIWQTPRWSSSKQEDQSAVAKRATCKAQASGYINFGGRCTEKVGDTKRVYATDKTVHQCLVDSRNFHSQDKEMFKGSYEAYEKKYKEKLKKYCDCPPIPAASDVKRIAAGGKFKNPEGRGKARSALWYTDMEDERDDLEEEYFVGPRTHKRHRGRLGSLGIEADTNPYADDILQCNQNLSDADRQELGLCTESFSGKQVYGVRQWHAVSTTFCMVVLNPVSCYMARFLKGTFTLSRKVTLPIRTWYIVHLAIILPMVCMYTTGMASITRQRPVLGYSYKMSASLHRQGGILLFIIAAFEVLSGFLRPRQIFPRKIVIALHWLGGVILHYGGVVLCILTYRIPASPTSFLSHITDKEKFNNLFNHMAPTVLVIWIAVDLLYNIYITLHVMRSDKKMGISRSYFPVILPCVVDRSHSHFKEELQAEEGFQKTAFSVYFVLSLLFFLVTCIGIYNFNTESKHGYGPMYCTHDEFNKFLVVEGQETSRC